MREETPRSNSTSVMAALSCCFEIRKPEFRVPVYFAAAIRAIFFVYRLQLP